MEYQIKFMEAYNAAMVHFTGSVNVNDEPAMIEMVKEQLIPKNWKKVIFNISQLDYIDSAGMGSFLTARSILNNNGGELVLLSPSPQIFKILMLAGFNKIFLIYDTEAEAVKGLSQI